jgi:hypothetical protein
MARFAVALATLVFLFMAGAASAQVVTVQQTGPTGLLFGISNGFETRGQTLPVPVGTTRLQSFTLKLSGDVTPVVRQYDPGANTIGPVLFTGTPHSGLEADVTTTIPGGLPVTPGSHIFIGGTQPAPGTAGGIAGNGTNPYPDGLVADLRGGVNFQVPNSDLYFIAVFGPEPVAAVPTLSEWAMILLA